MDSELTIATILFATSIAFITGMVVALVLSQRRLNKIMNKTKISKYYDFKIR